MREVIVVRWCDGAHEEPEQAITEHRVGVDGRKPLMVDLCSACEQQFATFEALVRRGVPVDDLTSPVVKTSGKRRGRRMDLSIPRPFACPFDNCPHPGSPNRSAWGSHLRTVHDIGLREADEMVARKGGTQPSTGVK